MPDWVKGKYDLIFDGGTSEHIFNFPQVLKNIHDLLKLGGIIIHAAPTHNFVDHGFYMFSPTVFYDFYSVNKFDILKSYIFEYKSDPILDWLIYDYKPGSIDHLSSGGWGRDLLGIFFVAQKTAAASGNIIPQQGSYLRTWKRLSSESTISVHTHILDVTQVVKIQYKKTIIEKMKSVLRKFPLVRKVVRFIYLRVFLRFPKKPSIVARY